MWEVPSSAWLASPPPTAEVLREAPVRARWWRVPGHVAHTFTHFRLELSVYRALVPVEAALTFWSDPLRCRWIDRRDLDRAALPTLMRKVIAHGLSAPEDEEQTRSPQVA